MARVMVIEQREQPRLADLLVAEGIELERTSAAFDVLQKQLQASPADLVVLEVPSLSSSVVRLFASLQAATNAPIAVFCERATERDVVAAYAAGAQTVVAEPVGPHELVARMRAVLRRSPPHHDTESDLLRVGPVVLDRARRQLTVQGEIVSVPRKEFDIAESLMFRAGSVVSRAQLVRDLWGSARDTKTLDVQVGRLRAKLSAAEGRQRIITVRGLGYRFATDEDLGDTDAGEQARRSAV